MCPDRHFADYLQEGRKIAENLGTIYMIITQALAWNIQNWDFEGFDCISSFLYFMKFKF